MVDRSQQLTKEELKQKLSQMKKLIDEQRALQAELKEDLLQQKRTADFNDEDDIPFSPTEQDLLRRDRQIQQSYRKLDQLSLDRETPSQRAYYPDNLALHNPVGYKESTEMIMVQNPVANLEDFELPNLTEHVPVIAKDFVSTQDEKKEAFEDC